MTAPRIPDASEFPGDGSDHEKLAFLLNYAVLAPSSHNSQPWFFVVHDEYIELHADRSRALPVTDPFDRELIISCGACLMFLRVAAAKFEVPIVVKRNEEEHSEVLAAIKVVKDAPAHPSFADLFDAIPQRVTNRFPYADDSVSEDQLHALREIAGAHRLTLRTFTDDENKHALAEMIAEGDRAQMQSDSWRREIASWLHHNRSRTKDGMPGYTQGMGEIMSLAAPMVVRTFDMGEGRAAKDLELAEHSPALCVLGTNQDKQLDWIHTGEALAHLLLYVAKEGLTASYLNQPIEINLLRQRLAKEIGVRFPQILLRVGAPTKTARPTPRRPAAEVTLNAHDLHGDAKVWQGF